MFVDYRGSLWGILRWQWRPFAFFTLASTASVAAHAFVPGASAYLDLPDFALAVVGGAIGIFVSFRTNSAYDRWWEGRKLWGRLINTSRHFCSQVLVYPAPSEAPEPTETGPTALQTALIRRHIGYVHTLRCLLRLEDPVKDADVRAFLDEADLAMVASSKNATHALLFRQLEAIEEEVRAGRLDAIHRYVLNASLRDLLDIQGGCERIKKTPFPRGYGYIAERLIFAYAVLFPLGVVTELSWAAIPMTLLVCAALFLIGEVGRVLEDPFTMFWPALPLSAMSKTIEINLRERLGDAALPPMPQPTPPGILM